MMALRKLFRLKTGSSSRSVGSKDNNTNKRSKKSVTTSSPSSNSSSPSPHNSSSQSTRICLVGGHSTARNHQIVPTTDQPMAQSSPNDSSSKPSNCTIRSRRLMKEFRELSRTFHNNDTGFMPYSIELVNDTLNEWNIKVYQFDTDSQFYRDMKELGIDYVLLNATFPENYPFAPPFVRVVSPHIEKGFVMEGGAICLELLTRHGWASAYTMEAVIMQLCASFVKGQARIKRNKGNGKEFSKKLAEASFRSVHPFLRDDSVLIENQFSSEKENIHK